MFKKRNKKTQSYEIDQQDKNIPPSPSKDFITKKRNHNQHQFSTAKEAQKADELMEEIHYQSKHSLQNVNDATRELEIDTERDKDAMAIRQRIQQISKDKLEGKIGENVYMGKGANIIYAEKSERDLSKYKVTGTLGPMRAPTNLRVNCRFDYAPGVCKDYKETGYCGFGDGCVFMHDRGDYKSGWELDEEWKQEQLRKEKLIREGKYHSDSESDQCESDDCKDLIPDKCEKCKNDFQDPVVTKCKHFFCEKCALSHYAKTTSCYVCHKPTCGIFNNAIKIISQIQQKRKKKSKSKSISTSVKTKPNEDVQTTLTENDNDNDGMEYLNNRNYALNFEESPSTNDNFEFTKDKSSKKNRFKTQNDWLYPSNYKSYI